MGKFRYSFSSTFILHMVSIKKIATLMLILSGVILFKQNAFAMGLGIEPTVYAGAGVILGSGNSEGRVSKFTVGAKLSVLELKFRNGNRLSMGSPGIGLANDLLVNFSLSPVSTVIRDRFLIGFDYILPSSSDKKGAIGLFIGLPL